MTMINPRVPVARSYREYVRLRAAHPTGPVLVEFSAAEVVAALRGARFAPGARRTAPATPGRPVAGPSAPPRPDPLADLEREVDALERRARAGGPAPLPPGWQPKQSER